MLCRAPFTTACADITDQYARRLKELPDFPLAQNISDVRTERRLYHVNQHCVMQAEISEASSGNPGIPPSSLMSFLRVKRAISGEVPLHTLSRVAVVPPPLLLV